MHCRRRSETQQTFQPQVASAKQDCIHQISDARTVYSEEEDLYLLCGLNYYGMTADDIYERIEKDITDFSVFRFDWFFKSQSPQEPQRRCNTMLGMIEKEAEVKQQEEIKAKGGARGKVS